MRSAAVPWANTLPSRSRSERELMGREGGIPLFIDVFFFSRLSVVDFTVVLVYTSWYALL
jgi:hypothetical protein